MENKKIQVTFLPKVAISELDASIKAIQTSFDKISFKKLTKKSPELKKVTAAFEELQSLISQVFVGFSGKKVGEKELKQLSQLIEEIIQKRKELKTVMSDVIAADSKISPNDQKEIIRIEKEIASLKAKKKQKEEVYQQTLKNNQAVLDPNILKQYEILQTYEKTLISLKQSKKGVTDEAELAAINEKINLTEGLMADRRTINAMIKIEKANAAEVTAEEKKQIGILKERKSLLESSGNTSEDMKKNQTATAETNENLKKMDTNIKSLSNSVGQTKSHFKDVQETSAQTKDILDSMGISMSRITRVVGIVALFREVKKRAKEAYETVKELDEKLTEIATVTGKTRDEMWGMFDTFNTLAKQLGTTTKEVIDASIIFYRQGLKTAQVMEMVRASAISAAIANISTSEASDRLTSALNGFQREATEAMAVADKFAALAAKSASSFDELSYALSKTAASAQVAGISMDHMLGFIAKVVETTREAPENIGTAFKTIIARMQQLQDVGKTLDDGISLNKTEKALSSIGVTLRNQVTGQFRDLDSVFNDLGDKWDDLDRNTKAYLATILAGSRQQSRFLALMNNYERTTELVTIAQNSAGEASTQFATHLTGLEAALNKLTASWEAAYQKTLNADFLVGAVSALSSLVDVMEALGPLISTVALAIALLTVTIQFKTVATLKSKAATDAQAMSLAIEAAQSRVATLETTRKALADQVGTSASALASAATDVKTAAIARDVLVTNQSSQAALFNAAIMNKTPMLLGRVVLALYKKIVGHKVENLVIKQSIVLQSLYLGLWILLIAAIGGAVYGLVALATAEKRHKKALQETINTRKQDLNTAQRKEDQMKLLIASYKELNKIQNKTKEQQEEYAKTTKDLAELLPNLVTSYDELGNAIINIDGAYDELNATMGETILKAQELLVAQSSLFQYDYNDEANISNAWEGISASIAEMEDGKKITGEIVKAIDNESSEYWKDTAEVFLGVLGGPVSVIQRGVNNMIDVIDPFSSEQMIAKDMLNLNAWQRFTRITLEMPGKVAKQSRDQVAEYRDEIMLAMEGDADALESVSNRTSSAVANTTSALELYRNLIKGTIRTVLKQYIELEEIRSDVMSPSDESAIMGIGSDFISSYMALLTQGVANEDGLNKKQSDAFNKAAVSGVDNIFIKLKTAIEDAPGLSELYLDALKLDDNELMSEVVQDQKDFETAINALTTDMMKTMNETMLASDAKNDFSKALVGLGVSSATELIAIYQGQITGVYQKQIDALEQRRNAAIEQIFGADDLGMARGHEIFANFTVGMINGLSDALLVIEGESSNVKKSIGSLFEIDSALTTEWLSKVFDPSKIKEAMQDYSDLVKMAKETVDEANKLSSADTLEIFEAFFGNYSLNLDSLIDSVSATNTSLSTLSKIQKSNTEMNVSSLDTLLQLNQAQLRYNIAIDGTIGVLSTASEISFMSNLSNIEQLSTGISYYNEQKELLIDVIEEKENELNVMELIENATEEELEAIDELNGELDVHNGSLKEATYLIGLYNDLLATTQKLNPFESAQKSMNQIIISTVDDLSAGSKALQELYDEFGDGPIDMYSGAKFQEENEAMSESIHKIGNEYYLVGASMENLGRTAGRNFTKIIQDQINAANDEIIALKDLNNASTMNPESLEYANNVDRIAYYEILARLFTGISNSQFGMDLMTEALMEQSEALEEYISQLDRFYNVNTRISLLDSKKGLLENQYDFAEGDIAKQQEITEKILENYKDIIDAKAELANEIMDEMRLRKESLHDFQKYVTEENGLLVVHSAALKTARVETQEFVEDMIQAYNDLAIALQDLQAELIDMESELAGFIQQRKESISSLNDLEDALLAALIARDRAALDDYLEYLDGVNYSLGLERDLLIEINDARKKEIDDQKKQDTLQKKIDRYNLISRDNSGMYLNEKLELEEEIAELRAEIAEDAIQAGIDAAVEAIDNEIEANDALADDARSTQEEREADMEAYWAEVDKIINLGSEEVLRILTAWDSDYSQLNKRRKDDMIETWKAMFDSSQVDVSGLDSKIAILQASIESLRSSIASTSRELDVLFSGDGPNDPSTYVPNTGIPIVPSNPNPTITDPNGEESLKKEFFDSLPDSVKNSAVVGSALNDSGVSYDQFTDIVDDYMASGDYNPNDNVYGTEPPVVVVPDESLEEYRDFALGEVQNKMFDTPESLGNSVLLKDLEESLADIRSATSINEIGDILDMLGIDNNIDIGTSSASGSYGNAKPAYPMAYAEGGLNPYTGLAMMHGTSSKPEAVLDPTQTKAFLNLADHFDGILKMAKVDLSSVDGDTVAMVNNISIEVDESVNEDNAYDVGEQVAEGIDTYFKRIYQSTSNSLSITRGGS